MTARQAQLRQLADQAVRDIVELDAQVADGEITEADSGPLRRRYQSTAGRALEALDALETESETPLVTRSRPRGWSLAYLLAAVVAVVAAVVLLPASLLERPAGGFVTGNEAVEGASGAPPLDPTGTVTDEQLEQVVEVNPEVIGMRLALAGRYVAQGEYEPAMRHYLDALRREPGNAEAMAHLGWLLLQIDQPGEALQSVEQALAVDPALDDALWFKANIQLYGLGDPAGAVTTLRALAERDLTPEVRAQVEQLIRTAEQRQGGSG